MNLYLLICFIVIVILFIETYNRIGKLNSKIKDLENRTSVTFYKKSCEVQNLTSDFYTLRRAYENHKHKYEYEGDTLYIKEPVEQE
jgi:hypothetical protein